jgi:hypothetical protein
MYPIVAELTMLTYLWMDFILCSEVTYFGCLKLGFCGKFDIGHFQISDLGYCRRHIVDSGYFKVLDF